MPSSGSDSSLTASELLAQIDALLRTADVDQVVAGTGALTADAMALDDADWLALASAPRQPVVHPARPSRPRLVAPRALAPRGLGTVEGRAALMHAVAHIEYNAIALALDAVARFAGQPPDYYRDWLSVASDEARHFVAVRARLAELGYAYGDFSAHDGLWEMAQQTAGDVLHRMALVPRVLEARGLDVTPSMIDKLRQQRDQASVEVLELILAEEVRHVAIGSRWFDHHCALRGLDPERCFLDLLGRYGRGRIKLPLNDGARLAAGFSPSELAALRAIAS